MGRSKERPIIRGALRLESYDGYDSSKNIPRSTNGQVWDQILKDLNEAIAVLPASYTRQIFRSVRATQSSARALAAA